MSLIHTCELNEVNPFDYLTELQKHRRGVGQEPGGLDALELSRRRCNSRPVQSEVPLSPRQE